MVELMCGNDLVTLGILTKTGMHSTAFIDHLEECDRRGVARGELVEILKQSIGGEKLD